jgi:DNA-binding beta-propeller fold protein YncE
MATAMEGQRAFCRRVVHLGLPAFRRTALATTSLGVLAALLAAVPAAAQFAYIPNTADRTVSVINTRNNTVTTTITLPEPDRIPFGVAVNPSGTRV